MASNRQPTTSFSPRVAWHYAQTATYSSSNNDSEGEQQDIEAWSWLEFPDVESCLLESAFSSFLHTTFLDYQGLKFSIDFQTLTATATIAEGPENSNQREDTTHKHGSLLTYQLRRTVLDNNANISSSASFFYRHEEAALLEDNNNDFNNNIDPSACRRHPTIFPPMPFTSLSPLAASPALLLSPPPFPSPTLTTSTTSKSTTTTAAKTMPSLPVVQEVPSLLAAASQVDEQMGQQERLWRRGGEQSVAVSRLFEQDNRGALAVASVVIDGLDVCSRHSRAGRLSAQGLENAVAYFVERGHPIMVLVPHWLLNRPFCFRQGPDLFDGSVDYFMTVLQDLRGDRLLMCMSDESCGTTPALSQRDVYDMVSLCKRRDAVLLSNNTIMYKQFHRAHPILYSYIENRQLCYAFDVDTFTPCHDMGKNGPFAADLLLK
eukprot:GHVS01023143.1.p1 GENE.GHVS01023143.1~~GHVS01023143.1.p1  ORF type:complete len:433 (-),score=90.81 GHVS01023143.1:499-1797(-)